MQDLPSMIASLSRPSLLVGAARFGVDEYERNRCLPRLLHMAAAPKPGQAILKLLEIKADLNDKRKAKMADYAIARHVEVLIALMGEARVLRMTSAPLRVVT
ncbi:DUF6477 family protein [Flavimaricola marinus]|uniref:Uncharacterized protein n=1 Tax=Flavimaricola marinus TaxID=1819565 RepID=A0A238LCT3_9RHOB|nr:DUF6477 family protein [Flavimaricola marinus]SMY07363.1 hypothetical protein LOM8899_01498 [Flavimaricola marinus]